jgi:iron complex transport system substrate-binding protein
MLGIEAEVISLDPSLLDEVLADVLVIGKATGTETRAESLIEGLRWRLGEVEASVDGRGRPRTFALEWGDPPYNAGHWVPEMIHLAGGEALLAPVGIPSVRVGWEAIEAADPDVVVFMPCGFDLDGAIEQVPAILDQQELRGVRQIYAAGANSFFSRPGPRLVDGVEALAAVLHPESGIGAMPGTIARVR